MSKNSIIIILVIIIMCLITSCVIDMNATDYMDNLHAEAARQRAEGVSLFIVQFFK